MVGGYFFGVVGAVAGAARTKQINDICSTLQIMINVNDLNSPGICITLINSPVKKNFEIYLNILNLAKSLMGHLEYINSTANNIEIQKK